MFNNDFDLNKYTKEIGNDFKIIYDVFCSYFLHLMEGKDYQKHIDVLKEHQTKEILAWINEHVIPFYESIEDFEKCARLKKVSELLKSKPKKDISKTS